MKTIIKLFICISLIYTPFFAFAGAAEKWEYDVIPDQSQILQVKGHKVDQYGAAVNDYEYNTKIDPKTAANKTKMGTVGFGRLLKSTGWGLLGSAALEALLEAVDWVIDPETQSIWRNKKSGDSDYGCFYTDSTGKPIDFIFSGIQPEACPLTALQAAANLNAQSYSPPRNYEFVNWTIPPVQHSDVRPQGKFKYSYNGSTYYETLTLGTVPKKDTSQADKEYLTPEQLADYANHTHPDYADPVLAPKLEPKYSPEIASDLWKPSNPWEETNSPTVQEVNRQLDQAQPEPKTEPEITPNPETGGMALPSFCSWAAPVCEYFRWAKQDDDLPDDEKPEIKDLPTPQLKEDAIRWSAQCPSDVQVPITMQGVSSTITFSWSPWCQLLAMIKPAIIASAYIGAAFIVLGLRT